MKKACTLQERLSMNYVHKWSAIYLYIFQIRELGENILNERTNVEF